MDVIDSFEDPAGFQPVENKKKKRRHSQSLGLESSESKISRVVSPTSQSVTSGKNAFKRSHFSGTHFSRIKRHNKSLFKIHQTEDDWTLLLPDEILLKIFQYLPKTCLLNISSVCQRWNEISSERILWRGIDISGKTFSFSNLTRILSKGVVALQMVGAKVHRSRTFSEPSEGYQLRMLDAKKAFISPKNYLDFLSQCRNLEKLNLSLCTLNGDICRKIGVISCLTVLDISHCSGVSAEFISQLNRLEELNVSFIKMDYTRILQLLSYLPITLKGLGMYKVSQQLSDADIFTICSSCPNLIELNICENEGLTDYTIDIVMKLLPNLQHLYIGGRFSITPLKLKELVSMRSLQTLSVPYLFDDEAVGMLSRSLVGVEVKKCHRSRVLRSLWRRNDALWGLRFDKF